MLTNIIETCPECLWTAPEESKSIWKRILHVLESLDHWFTDFSDYCFNDYFCNLSAEMDETSCSSASKYCVTSYKDMIESKIAEVFDRLDDSVLLNNSSKFPKVTFLDIILSQIRHIQINVGYCNEKFSSKGIKSPEWLGYNEENDTRGDNE